MAPIDYESKPEPHWAPINAGTISVLAAGIIVGAVWITCACCQGKKKNRAADEATHADPNEMKKSTKSPHTKLDRGNSNKSMNDSSAQNPEPSFQTMFVMQIPRKSDRRRHRGSKRARVDRSSGSCSSSISSKSKTDKEERPPRPQQLQEKSPKDRGILPTTAGTKCDLRSVSVVPSITTPMYNSVSVGEAKTAWAMPNSETARAKTALMHISNNEDTMLTTKDINEVP